MRILAIDPGQLESAYLIYEKGVIYDKDIVSNKVLRGRLDIFKQEGMIEMAIEGIASYGMAVGKTTFETAEWIGRFRERWEPMPSTKVYRMDVKMHLCHSMQAKDGNIRQAIIDKFPATGGGTRPQIGIKSQPGPLFGIATHLWSALAVAITFDELYETLIERK